MSEDKSPKKRGGLQTIRQAMQLWPFIQPYKGTIGLLILATMVLGASEAGRTVLIEPLLNKVFLAQSDAKDDIKDRLQYRKLSQDQIQAERRRVLAQARPTADQILADRDLTLGPPLDVETIKTDAGQALDRSRHRLQKLARDLRVSGPVENRKRILTHFAEGIVLQKAAREMLQNQQTGMAVALSIEARKASYETTFYAAWSVLVWIVIAAVAFALVLSVAQYFAIYLARSLVARIVIDIQNFLAKHLLSQELAYFESSKQGDFFSRLTNDVGTTQIALDVFFSDIIIHPLRLAFLLAMAIYFSPLLSVSLVLLGATVIIPVRHIGKKIRRHARRRQQSAAEALGSMQQMLSGIRTVKAFHREDYEAQRFRNRTQQLLGHGLSVIRSRLIARSTLNMINNLTIPIVFLGGGLLVLKQWGGIDAGSFAGFIGVVVMMYMPAKQLAKAWTQMQDASSGIERIFELIDKEAKILDKPDAQEFKGLSQGIHYSDVCFAYGERRVLHNIEFKAPAGTQTAIVGGTGHGKSTLVDLIPRFIVPESGQILIDGVDLQDFTRESVLAHIGIVTQDAFLFNDSIANNIRYGRFEASLEEVIEVAKKAQIHEDILAMPQGYDTTVGERGAMLSGGQIQRVTIARALLKNPQILILDEATSGLDSKTEQAVQEAFDELKSGRTAFVIAHRLSTIRNADQILVLKEGHIVERGSYDELLQEGGLFASLVAAQNLSLMELAGASEVQDTKSHETKAQNTEPEQDEQLAGARADVTKKIITDREQLSEIIARERQRGRRFAMTNGAFDMLHVGHLRSLVDAARQADHLLVALNSDASVKRSKGPSRPIVPEDERAEMVAALDCVSYVTIFDEATVDALLEQFKPEVYCKGTDYKPETIPETPTVEAYGGRLAIVGDPKDHSSTALVQRVLDLNKDMAT